MDGDSGACGEMQNDSDKKLVDDGAICPELYEKEKYKIVHLLKEPTKTNRGSLAEAILANGIRKNGTVKGQLCKVTARRSYCILNGFPSWVEICKNENRFAGALKKSAIVNLSPECGEKSTPRGRLEQLAPKWKSRWYDQKLKEELKPTIVICGGTFRFAIEQINKNSSKFPKVSTGMRYFKDEELGTTFIDCWHPSFRGNHGVEYCYFCESCKEIFAKL